MRPPSKWRQSGERGKQTWLLPCSCASSTSIFACPISFLPTVRISSVARPVRENNFTEAQLDKVDSVPRIKRLYRHGPVSIYDLRAGRARTAQRLVPALTGVGLVAGLCLFSLALLITGVWLTR